MGAFETIVQVMIDMNVFHLFFPWLLVLALTYGALDKYEIFGEQSVSGTIAFATATLAMGGIYLYVPAGVFTNFAAALAFGVFGIVGMIVLFAVAGVDVTAFENPKNELPGIAALVIAIVSFVGVVLTQLDWATILGAANAGGNAFQEVVMPILVLIFLLLVIGTTASS